MSAWPLLFSGIGPPAAGFTGDVKCATVGLDRRPCVGIQRLGPAGEGLPRFLADRPRVSRHGAQGRGSTAVPRCGISLIVILYVLKLRRLRPTRYNKLACREPAALISMFKGRWSEHCPSRSAPVPVPGRQGVRQDPQQAGTKPQWY